MKSAIIGSRSISDYEALAQVLQAENITEVLTGGAAGADALAERWAADQAKPLTVIRPDYAKYGKRATMVRNSEIIKQAAQVIAFWDGESRGTAATIAMAKRAGKPLKVIVLGKEPDTQLDLF